MFGNQRMDSMKKSGMKLIWFLAMILVVAGAASADSDTVSHAVTIEILPVKMLEIHDDWKTHSLSQTESGGTLATATTTYCSVR